MTHGTTHAIERSGRRALAVTLSAMLGLGLLGSGCGDEELPATGQRGVPGGAKKAPADDKGKAPTRRTNTAPAAAPGTEVAVEEPAEPAVKRPPPQLDPTSFQLRRDPFQGFVAAAPVQAEPDPIRAERKVQMRQYSFEDLKLVVIASSRRADVPPRALFVAGDGISGTVRQGEYFSSAEVLLAAVNRDYVEIEVVDEELAASLGMQRGERRAVYLRNE